MHRETQRNTEKHTLLKIVDFYIFSNIHVSFVAFFLVKITLITIGISENISAWFVFFSTLLSYNIIRFLRVSDIKNWYNLWIKQHLKMLYSISIISVIALVYLTFQLRLKAILILIPFSLATLFYVFPLKRYSLRNVAGLKLFLIAFSWAGITVLFPLVQNYMSLRSVDWIVFIQRFLIIIVLTIPFDIRDMNYDVSKLKTLPQQLGIQKTKHFGLVLLIVFFFLEFIKPVEEKQLIIVLLISFLSGFILLKATNTQNKYYSALFVEAIPIVWYLLMIMI
jgi:hypothetical protein